jgi:hypothetical protein
MYHNTGGGHARPHARQRRWAGGLQCKEEGEKKPGRGIGPKEGKEERCTGKVAAEPARHLLCPALEECHRLGGGLGTVQLSQGARRPSPGLESRQPYGREKALLEAGIRDVLEGLGVWCVRVFCHLHDRLSPARREGQGRYNGQHQSKSRPEESHSYHVCRRSLARVSASSAGPIQCFGCLL